MHINTKIMNSLQTIAKALMLTRLQEPQLLNY